MAKNRVTSWQCVPMSGPDDALDELSKPTRPANNFRVKCKHCSFPDLDFVPTPYFLTTGFSSPAETWSAAYANYLVRERVRKILELAVPKTCEFYPTADMKSKKPTPWTLVVPMRVLQMPGLRLEAKERCSKCKEPKLGYSFYEKGQNQALRRCNFTGVDQFKSREWWAIETAEDRFAEINKYRKRSKEALLTWSEYRHDVGPPTHKERWTRIRLERELYFSVRLAELWKQAKVKGRLVVSYDFKNYVATPEDLAWVAEKMALLAEEGLVAAPPRARKKSDGKTGKKLAAAGKKSSAAAEKWFQEYLKTNRKKSAATVDFAAIERKHKVKLPRSYKDFIRAMGSKKYSGINGEETFVAKVLPPQKLDFRDFRRGAIEDTDEVSANVDGVMFAVSDHGDCWVFDISARGSDLPVYHYDHELNAMQPWSASFAECIRRFVDQN